jgi:hypothetical protein
MVQSPKYLLSSRGFEGILGPCDLLASLIAKVEMGGAGQLIVRTILLEENLHIFRF